MIARHSALNHRALLRRLPPDLVKPLSVFDPEEPVLCPACGCLIKAGESTLRGVSANGQRSTDTGKLGGVRGGRGAQCWARVRCSDREKAKRRAS